MKNIFKSLFIPSGEQKELIAYNTYEVRWMARNGNYSFDVFPMVEVFTNEEDAKTFARSLRDAFKLVRNTSEIDSIKIKKRI